MTHCGSSYRHSTVRHGSVLLEALISMVLLSLVLGLAAQTSSAMIGQRKILVQQQILLEAKSNVMTYALALPYPEVSKETLERFAQEFPSQAADLDWQIDVQKATFVVNSQDVAAKRVSVSVRPRSADNASPARPLAAWRYPTKTPSSEVIDP